MFVKNIFLFGVSKRRLTIRQPYALGLAVGSSDANNFIQAAVATKTQRVQIASSPEMLQPFLFLALSHTTLGPSKMQFSETVINLRRLTILLRRLNQMPA